MEATSSDHGCRNQRAQDSTHSVETMEESQHLVRMCQIADMCIPACIQQAIAKSSQNDDEDKHRVGRVKSDDDVGDEVTSWSDQRYSSLSEVDMDEIVQGSACDVANEWRQEHQRYDNVSDGIIFLELASPSTCDLDPHWMRRRGWIVATYIRYYSL